MLSSVDIGQSVLQLTSLCDSSPVVASALCTGFIAKRQAQVPKNRWTKVTVKQGQPADHSHTQTVRSKRSSWVSLFVFSVFLTHFLLWMRHCFMLVPRAGDKSERNPLINLLHLPPPLLTLSAWGEGDCFKEHLKYWDFSQRIEEDTESPSSWGKLSFSSTRPLK